MCKRWFIRLMAFVLLLALSGNCFAAQIHWHGGAEDRDFSNPDNWRDGVVPGPGDLAFQWPPGQGQGATTEGPIIDETVTVQTVGIGWKWANAKEDTPTVIWEIVSGGELNVTGAVWMGRQNAWGQLDIGGGKMTVNGALNIGTGGNSIGKINLGGPDVGMLEVTGTLSFGGGGSDNIDIRSGTLILPGDMVSTVQGYIDNGLITAWGGNGTFQLDYGVTHQDKTTLTSTHHLNPNPAQGSIVSPGAIELSWALPDPCVPGQPVPVDVYFTDDLQALQTFTDPAAIQVVSKQNVSSVVVQAKGNTRYYWAVDTYLGGEEPYKNPLWGPIFTFLAGNAPPQVDAGRDVVTWLADGFSTGHVEAIVTDDGSPQPYTVQWTVLSEPDDPNSPDAVIHDPSDEVTSITLSAPGEYVLQLEAFDGEKTGRDDISIFVYDNRCEATQSMPDYVPLIGDVNNDCKVDELDLALVSDNLGKDNTLTDQWNPLPD